MTHGCGKIHELAHRLRRFYFPFDPRAVPQDGIYLLFENREVAHGGERIVRVGSHTGYNQLPSRLMQHFVLENKDRSIFRKNIGRALLNREGDSFLEQWNWDLTTRKAKDTLGPLVNREKQRAVEHKVTQILQDNFSFVVIPIADRATRLALEAGLIASISLCEGCGPSPGWLGHSSPKAKIRHSGLWQEQHLAGQPLTADQFEQLLAAAAPESTTHKEDV